MDKLNLEAIPDDVRWTIANALRAAATRWNELAAEIDAHPDYSKIFQDQAAEAVEIAEQMEDC